MQQEELVEAGRVEESQARSSLQPPLPLPVPPSPAIKVEMEEAEQPQATPPPQPPPPPPLTPPHATEVETEALQAKGGEHRRNEGLEKQRPPPWSLPRQAEILMPVHDGGFRGDQVEKF